MNRNTLVCLFSFAISVGVVACSSSENPPESGSGGQGPGGSASTGSAGHGGTTGSAGSGGTTGSAGASGAGGAIGTAGVAGTAGPGGTAGSAGATGAGGRGGAGGSSAGGGAGAIGTAGRGGAGGSTAGSAGTGGTSGAGGAATGGEGGRGGSGGRGGGGAAGNRGGAGGQSGGTAGTTSTGGAGGSGGGYNPCKASPCVILPLGDSITHGFSSTDDSGYRLPLFKLLVAANQNVTFIGSLTNGPTTTVSGQTFPRNHEGHDGFTVTQITGYVPPAKSFSKTPHIVLLHIGTNDMTMNADPTTTANQLSTLITNLVNAAPDALIVVAKIVPLGYSNTNYNSYIAKIPGVVQAHSSGHVIMVDMSTLPTSDIHGSGNVHPTDQGYADMANLWYGAIKGYLP